MGCVLPIQCIHPIKRFAIVPYCYPIKISKKLKSLQTAWYCCTVLQSWTVWACLYLAVFVQVFYTVPSGQQPSVPASAAPTVKEESPAPVSGDIFDLRTKYYRKFMASNQVILYLINQVTNVWYLNQITLFWIIDFS